MGLHYAIQLVTQRGLGPGFIRSVLEKALDSGVSRPVDGQYQIIGDPDRENVFYRDGASESPIESLVSTYAAYDRSKTSFSADLLLHSDSRITLQFVPAEVEGSRVGFWTHTSEVDSAEGIVELTSLASTIFDEFDFRYGAYMNENLGVIPVEWDDIYAHQPQGITLYSPEMVESIGRDRLLATPSFRARSLDGGGVELIVCASPYGNCQKLEPARSHLERE